MHPSAAPSKAPSATPSAAPSFAPSLTPTAFPSDLPSARPSYLPSARPTISQAPSYHPSTPPTGAPTTAFPTMSRAPTFTDTRIVTDSQGNMGVSTQCRTPVPPNATTVQDQRVDFTYVLNVVSGTDVFLAIDYVATQLQKSLSREYLTCHFGNPSSLFETHAISSLPVDNLDPNPTCPADLHNQTTTMTNTTTTTTTDCYIVDGAYTATIFYLTPQRRQRQRNLDTNTTAATTNTTTTNVITDPNVYNSFATSLQTLFASGELSSGLSNIRGTAFQNITNFHNGSNGGASGIGTGNSSDTSLSGGAIAGIVIGVICLLAILAALIVFAVTRRRRKRQHPRDEKAVNVTHVSNFRDLEPNDDGDSSYRDDVAMIADRSFLSSSDDGSFTSAQDRRYQVDVIVDEEQSFGTGIITVDPVTFEIPGESSNQVPWFVKANDVIDQQNQDDMKKRIEEEFNPPQSMSPPRGQRKYGIPDTMDL